MTKPTIRRTLLLVGLAAATSSTLVASGLSAQTPPPPKATLEGRAPGPTEREVRDDRRRRIDAELRGLLDSQRDRSIPADLRGELETLAKDVLPAIARVEGAVMLDFEPPALLFTVSGVRHPIVALAAGVSFEARSEFKTAIDAMRGALQGMVDRSVGPTLGAETARIGARAAAAAGDDAAAKHFHEARSTFVLALLETVGGVAGDRPKPSLLDLHHAADVAIEAVRELEPSIARSLAERIERSTAIDPALRDTILGAHLLRVGWDARGNDVASTVTDEQWAIFRARLGEAHAHLARAWAKAPERPQAAEELVTVALGGGVPDGESPDLWFRRAIAAQPDRWQAWSKMLGSLRPRWGGSTRAMFALGQEALATGLFDSSVPFIVLEALRMIVEDEGSIEVLTAPSIGADLLRLEEGYRASPSPALRRGVATWRLLHALRMKDGPTAFALVEDPNVDLDRAILRTAGRTLRSVSADARALGGPQRALVVEGDVARERGDLVAALAAYDKAIAAAQAEDSKAGDGVVRAIEPRRTAVRWEAALQDGAWTQLDVLPELPGWEPLDGQWAWQGGTVLSGTTNRGDLRVMPDLDLGRRFEVKAVGTFSDGRSGGDGWSILVGVRREDPAQGLAVSWHASKNTVELAWRRGAPIATAVAQQMKPQKERGARAREHELHVLVFDDTIVVRVDGVEVLRRSVAGATSAAADGEPVHIAFGLRRPPAGYRTLRLERIAVRALEALPPTSGTAQEGERP
jgi:hypothetical protein